MRFLDNFGLESESLVVSDTSGASHDVSYQKNTESDKDTLKKVSTGFMYLTHSLTTICDGLPKTYMIKQLRKDMNVMCHIQRTPCQCGGAEIDVNEALTFVRNNELLEGRDKPSFTVKFCGDRTNITRHTGLCVISFLYSQKSYVKKHQGDHCAIAVVKVADKCTNVVDAVSIGEEMALDFVKSLPDGFHNHLKNRVKTMETMKRAW